MGGRGNGSAVVDSARLNNSAARASGGSSRGSLDGKAVDAGDDGQLRARSDFEAAFAAASAALGAPDYTLHGSGWRIDAHRRVLAGAPAWWLIALARWQAGRQAGRQGFEPSDVARGCTTHVSCATRVMEAVVHVCSWTKDFTLPLCLQHAARTSGRA